MDIQIASNLAPPSPVIIIIIINHHHHRPDVCLSDIDGDWESVAIAPIELFIRS